MMGTLYKDILYNRKSLYWWLMIMVIYGIIFIPKYNSALVVAFLGLAGSVNFLLNVLTENFHSDWYTFLLTTPTKRKNLIKFLYFEAFLLTMLGLLCSLVIIVGVALISHLPLNLVFNSENSLLLTLLTFYVLFVESLEIFVSFKYGVSSGRTVSLIINIAVFCIAFSVLTVLEEFGISLINIGILPAITIIFLGLILGIIIFYYLSQKTIEKKDF